MVAFTRGKRNDPRMLSREMRAFYGEMIPKKILLQARGGISGIAPTLVLSSQTSQPTSSSFVVTTNFDNGTLYWVVTTNPATPTAAQIVAGRDAANNPATASGSQPIFSGQFAQTVTATGLTPLLTYTAFFVQFTSNQHPSNVLPSTFITFGPSLKFELASNSMYLGGPS